MFIVSHSKCAKELINLDFSPTLIAGDDDTCEMWLKHCNQTNMKFLKNSYGTLIHKDFNKFFKESRSYKIREKLSLSHKKKDYSLYLDHTNLIFSTLIKNVYILTSSPYQDLDFNMLEDLKNYPYNVYVFHPNFLNYHSFVLQNNLHPLTDLSYGFTDATDEEMNYIMTEIRNNLGFTPFIKIV